MCTPARKRYIFYTEVDDRFKLFQECVAYVEAKLKEEERAHLTEEQRKVINDKVALVADFMTALKADLDTRARHTDPTTSLDEIDKKLRVCKAEVDPLLNAPKPEPKKEEAAKPEEKKEEPKAADDPMNNAAPEQEQQPAPETKE